MAFSTTSIPKWLDYLASHAASDGTWPKSVWDKPLSALDENVGKFEKLVIEVALADKDGAVLVAEPGEKVRFLHNLQVVVKDAGGEVKLIGVSGLRMTATYRILDEDGTRGELVHRTRLAAKTPSLDDLVHAKAAGEFKSVKAGDDGELLPEDKEGLGVFWVHPKLWSLMPNNPIPGEEVAWKILENFKMDRGEGTEEGIETYALSGEQKELKEMLTWLWIVTNKVIKTGGTKEVTNTKEIDDVCEAAIGNKLRGTGRGSVPGTPNVTNVSTEEVTPSTAAALQDVARSMAQVEEKFLENQLKERERKKMAHRYTKENKELFCLLSAKDWEDTNPVLTPFTEQLLSDKDPAKALGYVQGELERAKFPCSVNSGSLVQFFLQGYCGPEYKVLPSGLTLFMCRPRSLPKVIPRRKREFIIRSAFGGEDLGDEGVKLFAKTDLYMPKTYDDLQKQLETMIGFLRMLNGEDNISLQGYQLALGHIAQHQQKLAVIESQPKGKGLWVRLAFVFDTAFQLFIHKFIDVIAQTREGKSAIVLGRSQLQWSMRNNLELIFAQVEFGHMPDLAVPSALLSMTSRGEGVAGGGGGQGRTNRHSENDEDEGSPPNQQSSAWHAVNPSPVAEWKIPAPYEQVFNFRDPHRLSQVVILSGVADDKTPLT